MIDYNKYNIVVLFNKKNNKFVDVMNIIKKSKIEKYYFDIDNSYYKIYYNNGTKNYYKVLYK